MSTYTLHYHPHTASLSLHWLLLELDVPFTLNHVNLRQAAHRKPEYLAINPKGRVPALTVKDADRREETYTEQAALLMILAERHPESHLFPTPDSPERAKAIEILFYISTNVLPTARDFIFAGSDPDDKADGPIIRRLALKRFKACWSCLESQLDDKDYMLGNGEESMSILDFLVVTVLGFSHTGGWGALDEGNVNLRRLAEKMVKRDSWNELLESEGLGGLENFPGSMRGMDDR